MTVTRTMNGTVYEFSLDLDAICKAESADPHYSVFTDMENLTKTPRFTTLLRLSGFIGRDYKEFVQAGFSISDLAEILWECISELGFRSDSAEPEQSS